MKCPRCQNESPHGSTVCEKCAHPIEPLCPRCGVPVPATAKFCPECGHAVAAVSAAPRSVSPAGYVPKHLAARILTSRAALEGERKQITVLFADLKSSLELIMDRDPEEARTLLDPVLEHMMEAVHRYEGTVNQVMGDGIMALFGAPLALEDHAVRACYAALRMQEAVRKYADVVFRSHGVPVQIRVGLNAGEVLVRSIGNDLHMDYTAVGQTTHLAARMEQIATPGTILLTPSVFELAEGYVEATSRGRVAIKGLSDPVEVYELTGATDVRSRLEALSARGFSRFVGRNTEIENLHHALERARGGQGGIVAVVGEPGVGKSRLVRELTRSHRTRDWLVVEANSVSYGRATSYLPVVGLLRAYFRLTRRDTAREVREKVIGKLIALDDTLQPIRAPLLALLDVPVDDPQWTNLDPEQRRQLTLDAIKRLLLREGLAQPLLVVFEDLHWIDDETQSVLDALIEPIRAARVLLLVTYRPEYRHGWGGRTHYTEVRLEALPAHMAGELLDGLLGRDASVEPLKTVLAGRAEGNPLFLEESVRGLVEAHALTGERGAYRLVEAVDRIHVPATVQAILAARIDRLPSEEKRLLQAAAVIGKDVPLVLLRDIAEDADASLPSQLAHLQSVELVYQTRLFPDLEYTFKHALTHEVAYASLLQDRRRSLHARIVEAIERAYPDRLHEHADQLAGHAVHGEVWPKAATWLRQAGRRAVARSAYVQARRHFEQALDALTRLPSERHMIEQQIQLQLDLRGALSALGETEQVRHICEQTLAAAERLGDVRLATRARGFLANAHCVLNRPALGLAHAMRALRDADAVGNVSLMLDSIFFAGQILRELGDYQRAIDVFSRATPEAIKDMGGGQLLEAGRVPPSLSWLAACHADLGRFDEAFRIAGDVMRIGDTLAYPRSVAMAGYGFWYASLLRGELAEAERRAARALEVVTEVGILQLVAPLAALLGYLRALSGASGEALERFEAFRANLPHNRWAEPLLRAWMSHAQALAGQMDAARSTARHAVELARAGQQRGHEVWALWIEGEVALLDEPSDCVPAQNRLVEALALGSELGMRPLVARCHAGLAKVFQRIRKPRDAEEHLAAATTMYREMGMTYWQTRLEAELGRCT